jgi:hypothetical protein
MKYKWTDELDRAIELEQLGEFRGRLEAARLNRNDFNHSLLEWEIDHLVQQVDDVINVMIDILNGHREHILKEMGIIIPMYEEGLPV